MLEKLSLCPKFDKILRLTHRLMLTLECNRFWLLHPLRDRTIPLLGYFAPTLALFPLQPSRICVHNSWEPEPPIFSSFFDFVQLFSCIAFAPLRQLGDIKRAD